MDKRAFLRKFRSFRVDERFLWRSGRV